MTARLIVISTVLMATASPSLAAQPRRKFNIKSPRNAVRTIGYVASKFTAMRDAKRGNAVKITIVITKPFHGADRKAEYVVEGLRGCEWSVVTAGRVPPIGTRKAGVETSAYVYGDANATLYRLTIQSAPGEFEDFAVSAAATGPVTKAPPSKSDKRGSTGKVPRSVIVRPLRRPDYYVTKFTANRYAADGNRPARIVYSMNFGKGFIGADRTTKWEIERWKSGKWAFISGGTVPPLIGSRNNGLTAGAMDYDAAAVFYRITIHNKSDDTYKFCELRAAGR